MITSSSCTSFYFLLVLMNQTSWSNEDEMNTIPVPASHLYSTKCTQWHILSSLPTQVSVALAHLTDQVTHMPNDTAETLVEIHPRRFPVCHSPPFLLSCPLSVLIEAENTNNFLIYIYIYMIYDILGIYIYIYISAAHLHQSLVRYYVLVSV